MPQMNIYCPAIHARMQAQRERSCMPHASHARVHACCPTAQPLQRATQPLAPSPHSLRAVALLAHRAQLVVDDVRQQDGLVALAAHQAPAGRGSKRYRRVAQGRQAPAAAGWAAAGRSPRPPCPPPGMARGCHRAGRSWVGSKGGGVGFGGRAARAPRAQPPFAITPPGPQPPELGAPPAEEQHQLISAVHQAGFEDFGGRGGPKAAQPAQPGRQDAPGRGQEGLLAGALCSRAHSGLQAPGHDVQRVEGWRPRRVLEGGEGGGCRGRRGGRGQREQSVQRRSVRRSVPLHRERRK